MKVISSMKKLKFWSRKKKKKKITSINHHHHPPPPSNTYQCCCHHQYHHHNHHHNIVEPSAPPLPPSWLDYDKTYSYDSLLASEVSTSTGTPFSGLPGSSEEAQLGSQECEIAPEFNPVLSSASSSSYQQYMVPNPVYGVPVEPPQPAKERSVGFFGCVIQFGAHLIRCFSPCFRIKEVQ
ncbi:hypothetical protein LguiB_006589 [Lonicera macranthoides]